MLNTVNAISHWARNRKVLLLLLLVIGLGTFLRVYGLGAESIWLDESHSVEVASQGISSIVSDAASGKHTPLYFLVLHSWTGLFGESEIALRFLSAIFGIASLALVYQVGKTLYNRNIGLIASFLSTISIFQIYYSQEARPYSLLLLLSLLSYFFLIQILKSHKKWHYPCYLLSNVLLLYTHPFGLVVIAAQLLFLLLFWTKYRPQRLKLLGIQVGAVVATTPVFILLADEAISVVRHGFWAGEPAWSTVYSTIFDFSNSQNLLVFVFFCLAVLALLSIKRTEGKWIPRRPVESLKGASWNVSLEGKSEMPLLVIWLFLPIVILFIISKLTTPVYVDRYLIGASPALYILVAKGLDKVNIKRVLCLALLVIMVFSGVSLAEYYADEEKEQWREVAALVETNAQESDVIIFVSRFKIQRPFDYYFEGHLPKFRISDQVEDNQEMADFLNMAVRNGERLWLVVGHWQTQVPMETFLLDRYGRSSILIERQFTGIRVLLFTSEETTEDARSVSENQFVIYADSDL